MISPEGLRLTQDELTIGSLIDSCDFGFVDPQNNLKIKSLLNKAVDCLDNYLRFNLGNQVSPKIYCKLGHFHLLLNNFPKGK